MELIIKSPTIRVVSETQTKILVPYIVENESKELWYLIESNILLILQQTLRMLMS